MNNLRNEFLREAENQGKSEKYKASILQYIAKLEDKHLPVIYDSHHLAYLLDMSYDDLNALSLKRSAYYKYYTIRKRAGGRRRILAPFSNLKRIQRWILENILDKVETPECVTGFVHGRSIFDNAKPHENKAYILKLDLKNFFESISSKRVYGLFLTFGYGKQLSYDLARLCTTEIVEKKLQDLGDDERACFEPLSAYEEGFLVQGAPSSPSIANKIAYKLDKRLQALADKHASTYTRYADDITFSADRRESLPDIGVVQRIIESEGFVLNPDKVGIYSNRNHQEVTGLLIDEHVRVSSRYKRDILRHIHFCKRYGVKGHLNRVCPDKTNFQQWLYGRICFVYSIEPVVGKRMFEEFDEIDWFG